MSKKYTVEIEVADDGEVITTWAKANDTELDTSIDRAPFSNMVAALQELPNLG